MESTIIAGKPDTEIYLLAKYIYGKHFRYDGCIHGDDMIQMAVQYLWEQRDTFDREKGSLHSWLYGWLYDGFRWARGLAKHRTAETIPVKFQKIGCPVYRLLSDRVNTESFEDQIIDSALEFANNEFMQRFYDNEFKLPCQDYHVMVAILGGRPKGKVAEDIGVSASTVSAIYKRSVNSIKEQI